MSDLGRVFVIFNPAAGRGRGARRIRPWLELLEEAIPHLEHAVTRHAGEERDLADRAVEAGFDTVVAVGGDGTWSHVANRLAAARQDGREVRFGLLPSGTGNDFARNLGMRYGDMAHAARCLISGRTRKVDVGRVVSPCHPDGQPDRPAGPLFFLNVVGFGFDVAVIDAAAGARFLRGEPLYKVTALQQLFRFPGMQATVRGGAGEMASGEHLMLTVSNGRFFGGGFPIAPEATVEDGRLHACLIGDAAPLTRARLFSLAQKGRHVESDRVRLFSGGHFAITCDTPPRFEVDGDLYVSLESTVELEVLPGLLDVITG